MDIIFEAPVWLSPQEVPENERHYFHQGAWKVIARCAAYPNPSDLHVVSLLKPEGHNEDNIAVLQEENARALRKYYGTEGGSSNGLRGPR